MGESLFHGSIKLTRAERRAKITFASRVRMESVGLRVKRLPACGSMRANWTNEDF